MSTRRTHPERRWLHSVPSTRSYVIGPFALADDTDAGTGTDTGGAPRLLDGPVVFDLRSREHPAGVEAHDLDRHREVYGPLACAAGAHGGALVDAIQSCALTGRGGGHFPVATKWRATLAAGGAGVVVANGAEGEPASAKDAAVLQLRPHLVLDGLTAAAEAVRARSAVVWLHAGDNATHRAVSRAIAERRMAGIVEVPVRIEQGPDHYLSGESSAVVRALSGGPALPYLARLPASSAGVLGRPTLLHNVETLARVALLARGGAADGTGSLVTLVGAGCRTVLDVAGGESFAGVLARSALGAGIPQAVLVGGYGGTWLPWADLAHAEVSECGLSDAGASLGAGVLAPLPSGACGLAATARLVAYLAANSARQCGPCLFGLPAMSDLVHRLAHGRTGRGEMRLLRRYGAEVDGRGACHHPDGAVRMVRSALRTFAADVRRHLEHGPCPGASQPQALPVPEVW